MDQELIDLIPAVAPSYGPSGRVWQVATDEAKAEYPDENFIITRTVAIKGCIYLGTIADVQASIAKMNEVSHA